MPWRPLTFTPPCDCYTRSDWQPDEEGIAEVSQAKFVAIHLWTCDDGLWDKGGSPIWSLELPVSEQLRRDLDRLICDYDMIGEVMAKGRGDCLWECSPSFPRNWFNRRGEALKERLILELGPEWTVTHKPLFRTSARDR